MVPDVSNIFEKVSPKKQEFSSDELLLSSCGEGRDSADSSDSDSTVEISFLAQLLRSGTEAQRAVILFDLQNLLEQAHDETIECLVPPICENVPNWPVSMQVTAAEALGEVLRKTSTPKQISKLVCDAAFQIITRSTSDDIFEGWGEILVVALPNVEWSGNYEISFVISVIDDFAVSTEEVKRKLVARVLGSLSTCLNIAEIESYVLNRALHLADDSDVDVRGMVAESLAIIGAALDIEIVESEIWPKLLTLLKDADARIHAATLRTISHILQEHKDERETSPVFKTLLPPVFISECQLARESAEKDQRTVDDDTYLLLEIFSTCYGPLLFAAHKYISDESDKKHAFQAFLSMSTCNGPIVRRCCAFNFPGVSESLKEGYTADLSNIAEFLANDADSETRWNLAAGIHETCRILVGNGSVDSLFKTVVSLLQDRNPLVRMNTLQHFQEILAHLSRDDDISTTRKLTPMFQNLTALAVGNWRTQELLARQLERASELVPPDCLRVNVLPLLRSLAEESPFLVRKAAMPAIARAIRCLPTSAERERQMNNFISEWGRGAVYWMRIAFIDCASSALQVCSSSLFQSLFATSLFELAHDSVTNVRLRLAGMIHEAAFSCHKNSLFRNAIDRLLQDEDADVRCAMEGVNERIEQKLKDIGSLDLDNERREEAERQIEQRAERLKLESRKKGGRGKMRASNIFLRKVSIPQFIKLSSQNDASPTSVTQGKGFDDASSAANNGSTQTDPSLKGSDSSRLGTAEGFTSTQSPKRTLLKVSGRSREESHESVNQGRHQQEVLSSRGSGDGEGPPPLSPRRGFRQPFGRNGDEGSVLLSPRRWARAPAERADDPLSPSGGGRNVLMSLLSNVVPGSRNRT